MSVSGFIREALDIVKYGGQEVNDPQIKGIIRYPLRIEVERHSNGNTTFHVMRKDMKVGRFCKPARPGWGWSYLAMNVFYDNWDEGEFYDAEDHKYILDKLQQLNSHKGNVRNV